MIVPAIQLYKNAYSGLTRRIWLLSIVMLINRSGTMVLAFMTLYCNNLGFTTKQGGLVVAIYGVGSIAGAFLGGKITDKFGFYYTQFTALFFGGTMFILLGQMRSYEAICICTFFLSMVNESFRPANAAAIAHYSTEKNRTQSFSLVRLAINVGWSIGVAVGGFLASINYHLLFWTDGFTNIAAALSLLIILPRVSLHQQRTKTDTVQQQGTKQKTLSAYDDKAFLKFLVLTVLFALCFFQIFTTVPIYFKKGLHLDEFWIGTIMSLNGILIAIVEMVLVFKLEGRKPYLTLMCYGSVIMAIAYLLLNLPIANGFIIAVFSMLVITVAEMMGMPFMNSYYIGRSSDQNRGQYAGLYTMSWSLAQVIGSSCGALFAAAFGFFNLWLLVGFICLVAASGFYWLQRKVNIIELKIPLTSGCVISTMIMKKFKYTIAAFFTTCFMLIITAACQHKEQQKLSFTANEPEGFVVMELFTSQGCSSCPPADELLGKYATMNNKNIIPLAFHVDYWNRLGWTDSFSSAKFSKRQRDYAMFIAGASVYTPQLIINGEKEMVGSETGKISVVVANELNTKPVLHITIDKIEKQDKRLHINFSIDKALKFTTMQAALVQKKVITNILRGENSGLKLTNYNVVREYNSIAVENNPSSIDLNIPKDLNDSDFMIVLYTQDDTSGKITGAIQRSL